MDDNNVHTSVVIELANQEEPEDQKTYQIDIDDLDLPKDYVIDQIFCGENVTVYALFEVPEGTNKNSEKHLMEMSSPSIHDDYKFFRGNSFKKLTSDKKSKGYKKNLSVMASEEETDFLSNKDPLKGSFYCLQHLGGNYEMLTPEKKNSELKILYSNEIISKSSNSSKFKAVSKGVNTDIVQCPKIIEEVQKAVGLNLSFLKTNKKSGKTKSTFSSKPSYEIIEMDMEPSFSSLGSSSDSRKYSKKSIPNFFLVPLLMMEDGVLSHFQKEQKKPKFEDEKISDAKSLTNIKVCSGTNTDESDFGKMSTVTENSAEKKEEEFSTNTSQLKSLRTDTENAENSETNKSNEKTENLNRQSKTSSKEIILMEIKEMQGKLNALIKTLESNNFKANARDESHTVTKPPSERDDKDNEERAEIREKTSVMEIEIFECKRNDFEGSTGFLPLDCLSDPFNSNENFEGSAGDVLEREKEEEVPLATQKSFSLGFVPDEESSSSGNGKKNEKHIASKSSVNWEELNEWRGSGLSKSETNIPVFFFEGKYGFIHTVKKSLSLDLRDDKVEVLKKIKNFSLKLDGSSKTKSNKRILVNQEAHSGDSLPLIKTEIGNDGNKKSKTSKTDLLSVNERIEKLESCSLKEIKLDVDKKEKGDAKSVCPKENLITSSFSRNTELLVHYCNTNVTASDNSIKLKQNLSPCRVKPKTAERNSEVGRKAGTDAEKPLTPSKNQRKVNAIDPNSKKETKPTKKLSSRSKVGAGKSDIKEVILHDVDKKKYLPSNKRLIKNSTDLKPHADKFNKSDVSSNPKIPQMSKQDEKQATKSDRLLRPPFQKREQPEQIADVLGSKETEPKLLKKKSFTLIQADSSPKKSSLRLNVKENAESATVSEKKKIPSQPKWGPGNENPLPLSSKPSSVVVELFSKKPHSADNFDSDPNQESTIFKKNFNKENVLGNNNIVQERNNNSNNVEKPIVKSVWALTKVLLYEDGTKKLEVLEASLTPPGYCLNQPIKPESEKSEN